MLSLHKISLFQFKNHGFWSVDVQKNVICITGLNGTGKTNILDGIYYACFTKSYFSSKDNLIQEQNKLGFYVEAHFLKNEIESRYKIIYRETGKKEFYENGDLLKSAKEYLQNKFAVFITPDDSKIITEGAEYRRRFIDSLLSITEHDYLTHLISYNKIITLRNALLKNWQKASANEREMLSIYTEKLKPHLIELQLIREKNIPLLLQYVNNIYADFCGARENINIKYEKNIDDLLHLDNVILKAYPKDIALQRTSWGIHKDDLEIEMNENSFKQIASQGQRKTMLFALKLSAFEFIKNKIGYYPILLLDDVFEKLDAERSSKLFEYIKQNNFQTFITDTDKKRLEKEFGEEAQYVELK